MKFNLFFVLLSIFAIIALTHPSAGSRCKKPCCTTKSDCGGPVGVECEMRIPCGTHPGCGTCRPVVPCIFPCCLEDSHCGVGYGLYCNVKTPCGAGCGTCEVVD